MTASAIASIAVLFSFFGYPTTPDVTAPDSTTCVDVGRTYCTDGSVFGPAAPEPATMHPCDTDAECARLNGAGGYGTD